MIKEIPVEKRRVYIKSAILKWRDANDGEFIGTVIRN